MAPRSELKPAEMIRLKVIPQHPTTTPQPLDVQVRAPVLTGPVGSRVAVFDYNRELDELLEPATPRADGSFPDYEVGDVRFHQLNTYAVIARAIELVELELGRGLSWGFEGNRLIALPHAGYWNNAFYSEDTQSLQFYSFTLPDQSVYHTCLVHDIVAHETGHALLDAIRDRYTEANDPETGAIHEAVGDLTAIFAALSHEVVRTALLEQAADDLRSDNVVASIAEQFEADENEGRSPLRNLTKRPPAGTFDGVIEPHGLSLKLTQAVWEGLAKMYDLNRFAGDSPDDALKLARTAAQRMVVRGLDYLPPADATFVEFATAMLLADAAANPRDDRAYRTVMAQAFVESGIGRSVVALMPPLDETEWQLPPGWPRVTPTEAYLFLDAHRDRLALAPAASYRDFTVSFQMSKKPQGGRSLRSRRSARRRKAIDEIDEVNLVYEYPVDVELRGVRFGALRNQWVTVRGGGTLVFDVDGRLRQHAEKPVTAARIRRALGFMAQALDQDAVAVTTPGEQDQARREVSGRPFFAELSGSAVVVKSNPAARCGRVVRGEEASWL